MTARKRPVRFALLSQSRSYARAPEVCPLGGHGVHDATLDETIIRGWWSKYPNANVGLALDEGTFVLDVDEKGKGPVSGGASLHALECEHEPLPDTVYAITGIV